jgi:type I restriction enzyme, R subunit
MTPPMNEGTVELAALAYLEELGYAAVHGSTIAPEAHKPERVSYGDVVLVGRLKDAIKRLNTKIPAEAQEDALRLVLQSATPSLIEENRRLHKAIIEGVPVEFYGTDGVLRGDKVRLVDFDDAEANDWLAVNQFTVIEAGQGKEAAKRRPDVVAFVNGLPLGVIELKNPGDENATMDGAFNQLQTYKAQIPSLFRTNAALLASDGLTARIGSLTADRERFMPWRTIEGDDIVPKGSVELETVVKGVFEKRRFLRLLKDFIVFGDTGGGVVKILAGYHQFHAVGHAVAKTLGYCARR